MTTGAFAASDKPMLVEVASFDFARLRFGTYVMISAPGENPSPLFCAAVFDVDAVLVGGRELACDVESPARRRGGMHGERVVGPREQAVVLCRRPEQHVAAGDRSVRHLRRGRRRARRAPGRPGRGGDHRRSQCQGGEPRKRCAKTSVNPHLTPHTAMTLRNPTSGGPVGAPLPGRLKFRVRGPITPG